MSEKNIHIRLRLLLLLSNSFLIISIKAQDSSAIHLKEFEIADTRFEKYPGILYLRVDTVFSALYSSFPLTTALEFQTGAYVRANSNGTSATISFRGTGADKTNVLWNGFHINSGSLGMFDLSLLPVSHADNLQIALGSASSVFGNASIGATVIMDHNCEYKSSWKIKSKQDVGSYGYLANSASAEVSNTRFSSYSGFTWQQANNDFLYQDKSLQGFPWLPMPQAQFNQITATQYVFYKPNHRNETGILLNYNQQYRQIPPSIGMALNQAAQFDRNIRAAITGKHILGRSSHLFTQWGAGYFMDELNYSDQNIHDSTWVHQAQVYFIQKWGGWKKIKLEWGAHYQIFVPIISQYNHAVIEHRISLMSQAVWTPKHWLSLFYSVRQQITPGFSPPVTGSLGSNWMLMKRKHHNLSLRTMLNNGYRVPTLNDRYWTPGGNPDLLPELSWNVEGGIRYEFNHPKISFSADLNGYSMWVNNWIAWTPQNAGYWSPVNVNFVRLAGFESNFSISGHRSRNFLWKISTQYHLTSAQDLNSGGGNKQLIYVPIHTSNTTAYLYFRGFFLLLTSKVCSERFIRTDNSLSLPAYFLGDATFGRKFTTRWLNISAECMIRNFTNTQYQSVENRPLPGIQFMGSLTLEWNKSHYYQIKKQKLKS